MIPYYLNEYHTILGKISYMNVKPVYYGLEKDGVSPRLIIKSGSPAVLNRMIQAGRLDISPVSSAAYAKNHEDWLILPGFSISCDGPVLSVLLVSRVPFKRLENRRLILTRDSAAAAGLLKCLLHQDQISPRIATGRVTDPAHIGPDTAAGLVIGDAALKHPWRDRFEHVYDLGDMWKQRTGLPFVFAVWAVRKTFAQSRPESVIWVARKLGSSYDAGKKNMDAIIREAAPKLGLDHDACRTYYEGLHYDLGHRKRKGLDLYFQNLSAKGDLPNPVTPRFFETLEMEYDMVAA